MSEPSPHRLIVCAGVSVNVECGEAMGEFLKSHSQNTWRFVMSEWLNDDQYKRAALLWVVDDSEPWEAVQLAMSNRIPLLVPEDNEPMKQVCMSARCGMFYRGPSEARACLEFLLTNEVVRPQLGANGQAYLRQLSKASPQ